ncbi:SRPBCC domain-containing protein [bacterium]|nr:SRPBCC domain-containing protein [bacterium]
MEETKKIRLGIHILGKPADVFDALTKPELMKQWLCDGAEVELKPGGKFRFWGEALYGCVDPKDAHQILSTVQKPSRLEIRWPWIGMQTRLIFEIDTVGQGSIVTITHELLDNSNIMHWYLASDGVQIFLYNLRHFVETGRSLLNFSVKDPGNSVRMSVTIDAPPEDVWSALTVPEKMDEWISTRATVDLKTDGKYNYGWKFDAEYGPRKIIRIEPGKSLTTDWVHRDFDQSIVEWTIEGQKGKTTLTLYHSGFIKDMDIPGYIRGWYAYMGAIKAFSEHRDQAM